MYLRRIIVLLHLGVVKIGGLYSKIYWRSFVLNAHKSSSCRFDTLIKFGERISVGRNTRIGPKCVLGAMGGIHIGSNVVISRGVQIETAGLTSTDLNKTHSAKPIIIGDNCWIGTNAIILGGVNIGKDSIVGAGVVVTKDLPARSVIVGARPRIL